MTPNPGRRTGRPLVPAATLAVLVLVAGTIAVPVVRELRAGTAGADVSIDGPPDAVAAVAPVSSTTTTTSTPASAPPGTPGGPPSSTVPGTPTTTPVPDPVPTTTVPGSPAPTTTTVPPSTPTTTTALPQTTTTTSIAPPAPTTTTTPPPVLNAVQAPPQAPLAIIEAEAPTVTLATIVAFLDWLHRFLQALNRPPGYVDLGHGVYGPSHLLAIRRCESRNDYGAVSRYRTFRGAYQFTVRTWNWTAARNGRYDLVGVLPNEASPVDQDQMAVWNYEQRNPRREWPVCSRRR